MTVIPCKIYSVKKLSSIVYQLILYAQDKFCFLPGQYLYIIDNEGKRFPFSIVSVCSKYKKIELHISKKLLNNNLSFDFFFNLILEKKKIYIDLSFGNAWFRINRNNPILLIAGGTGFSYISCILDVALKENINRKIFFYWGVKKSNYFYNLKKVKLLLRKHKNFIFVPVVEILDNLWKGRTGILLDIIIDDFVDLSNYDIYIAGRFEISRIVKSLLCKNKKANPKNFYGDAFEFL